MPKFPGRGKEEDPKSRRARFLSFLRQEPARAEEPEETPPQRNGHQLDQPEQHGHSLAPPAKADRARPDEPDQQGGAAIPWSEAAVVVDEAPVAVPAATTWETVPESVTAEDIAAAVAAGIIPADLLEDAVPAATSADYAAAEVVEEVPAAVSAEEIPAAVGTDDIPAAVKADEIPEAVGTDEIPAAVGADEVPATEVPETPLTTLPAGALIADEEIIREEPAPTTSRASRWAHGEENGKERPSELFPLRGRRDAQPDAEAWESARKAREAQQAAAREQAMAPHEERERSEGIAGDTMEGIAGNTMVGEAPAEVEPAAAAEVSPAKPQAEVEALPPAAGAEEAPVPSPASPVESVEAQPPAVEEASVPQPEALEDVPAGGLLASLTDEEPPLPSPERPTSGERSTRLAASGSPIAERVPPMRRQGVSLEPAAGSGPSGANDVAITQVSVSGEIAPRKEITFSMRYRNRTRSVIGGLTLRCDMPTHTSYMPESTVVNGTPVPDERANSPLVMGRGLPLGEIPPGWEGVIEFTCILNPGLRDGTLITHVTYLLQDTRPLATQTCYVRSRGEPAFADPDTCRLTASPAGRIMPGDLIEYSFAVRNVGTGPATGIALIAEAPANAVYVPNSTRWEGRVLADVDRGSALFTNEGLYLGTLAPGEAHGASFQVRVQRPLDHGTQLTCCGEVRSHEAAPVPIAPVTHEVVSAPAFSPKINKVNVLRAGEEVRDAFPGEVLTYTLELSNTGDAHAYDAVAWMPLPRHVEYLPGTLRREGQNVPDRPDGSTDLFTEQGLALGRLDAAPLDSEPRPTLISWQGRVAWPLRNGTEILLAGAVGARDVSRQGLQAVRILVHSTPRFEVEDSGLVVQPAGRVRPGEVLNFTIRYRNSGDAPATDVLLRAELPTEAPYVPSSTRHDGRVLPDDEGMSPLFGERGLHLGTVDAGVAGEVTFQATVRNPLDCGTMIQARAALTCAELVPKTFERVALEVVSAPDFAAEKVNRLEVSPAEEVRPGEALNYTLQFKNQGDANASGVVLHARAPEHTAPVEGSLAVDGRPTEGVPAIFKPEGLRLGDLPAGRGGRITYAVTVERPLENATQIYHSVQIACDQTRPVETKAVLVMVVSAPDFLSGDRNRLDVFPKGDVSPGQKLVYTLDYRNSGDADASGVFLKARLPAHTTYLRGTTRVNGQLVDDFRGTSPLFSPRGLAVGTVPVDLGGKITFEVRVNTPLDNGTLLECQAQVGCAELPAALATNKVSNRVTSAPDFSSEEVNYLGAAPSGETQPDEVVTYHLRYRNTGNARATGVVLRAEVDDNVSYKAGSTFLNGRPIPDVDASNPIFTPAGLPIGTVDAEASGELTFQVKVHSPLDNGTTLAAQGFVLCESIGQISTNRLTHAVMSVPSFTDGARNRVEVSAVEARPGDRLTYTIHYFNGGKAHAQGVWVRAVIPPKTNLVPESVRVNGRTAGPEEATVLFSEAGLPVGSVAAAEGGSLRFEVDVAKPLPNGTPLLAHAIVGSQATAPAQTSSVQSTVRSRVDFSASQGNEVRAASEEAAPGDVVLYTVRYRNGGDCNASGVSVTVQLLSPELVYVPHMTTLNGVPVPEQGPVGLVLTTQGLTVGDVPAGSGGEATFTVRVGRGAADGVRLGVRAEIRSDQGGVMALQAPDLRVSAPPDFSDQAYNNLEAYPAGKVACGEVITYTVNYGNRGNAVAPQVVLRAQLPEQVAYVAGTTFMNGEPVPDLGGTSPLFHKRGLAVGAVEPHAYGNAVFQLRVAPDLPNGTVIGCSAMIDCGGRYSFGTNTTRNTVSSTPDFGGPEGAHLEVSPVGDVSPRDTLTYVFNYRNRGNAAATHVALRCRLPEYTRYLARSTKLSGLPVQDMAGTSPLFTERGLVVPEVSPGGSGRVSFRVQVASPLPSGSEVPAQMTLACQQAPPLSSNRVVTTVISYPDFTPGESTFMQVFPHGAVAPCQVVTYVLYYQNAGSTTAEALHVRTRPLAQAPYLPGSTRVNGLAVADDDDLSPLFGADGIVLRNVEAGAAGNVSFQVRVDDAAPDGTALAARVELTTAPATTPAVVNAPQVTISHAATLIAAPVAPVVPVERVSEEPPMVEAPRVVEPVGVAEVPVEPLDQGAREAAPRRLEIPSREESMTPPARADEPEAAAPAEPDKDEEESRPRLVLDIDRLRRFREERARSGGSEAGDAATLAGYPGADLRDGGPQPEGVADDTIGATEGTETCEVGTSEGYTASDVAEEVRSLAPPARTDRARPDEPDQKGGSAGIAGDTVASGDVAHAADGASLTVEAAGGEVLATDDVGTLAGYPGASLHEGGTLPQGEADEEIGAAGDTETHEVGTSEGYTASDVAEEVPGSHFDEGIAGNTIEDAAAAGRSLAPPARTDQPSPAEVAEEGEGEVPAARFDEEGIPIATAAPEPPPPEEEEIPVAAPAPAVEEEEIPVAVGAPAVEEEEIPVAVAAPAVEEEEIPVAVAAPAVEEEEILIATAAPEVEEEEVPVAEAAPEIEEAEVPAAEAAPALEEDEEATDVDLALPEGELGEELPLSVYLTITRDHLEVLRSLQSASNGLLAHFDVSAQLMARSFYGTYKCSDAKTLNSLMGSLSRSLADYHKTQRTLLAELEEQGQNADLVGLSQAAHDEGLAKVQDFLSRFFDMQEQVPLSFSPPRHDAGRKSFIVGIHLSRQEYGLVARLLDESKAYAGFLRHLIFVQTLMGQKTAARTDAVSEQLDDLLREYSMACKSTLNRLLVNARSQKRIDLSRTNRQLERTLKALVDFLSQHLG